MSSYQKRRKPNYYNQRSKRRREFVLKPGLKGFLCTCNSREKDCIRESYNILNEYADKLYGKEKALSADAAASSDKEPESRQYWSDDDIESAINKELDDLKAERTKLPSMRRFQVVESGATNCIFIQTALPEPVDLAYHIMKDLEATRKQKSRFLLRLLPIEVTCKAYVEDIRSAADSLFDKYFSKEGKTFAVLFNRRNSSGVNREDMIHTLAEMVFRKHPDNRADLKHPQLAILVEVIRNMCCLTVIPEYFELRKYNLLELSSPEGGIKLVDSKVKKEEDEEEAGRKGEGDGDPQGSKCDKSEDAEEPTTSLKESQAAVHSSSEVVDEGRGDGKEDLIPEASNDIADEQMKSEGEETTD